MTQNMTYSLPALNGDKRVRVVNISDLKVSTDPNATLVTYALGSCVAVMLYDPRAKVGGLLHYLLPDSSPHSKRTGNTHGLLAYADTAIPTLLDRVCAKGAVKRRLIVKAAGAASVLKAAGRIDVAEENHRALLNTLAHLGLTINAQDLGGQKSRTAMLEIDTGLVTIRKARAISHL